MYVLLLGWLTACSKPKDQQTEEFMAIKASQVVTEQISSERCYSFISQPYKEAVLSFRVGGIVDEFNVQSGQFFKQGSRIASIDERDFIIQKDHAQALYEQATSEYNRERYYIPKITSPKALMKKQKLIIKLQRLIWKQRQINGKIPS